MKTFASFDGSTIAYHDFGDGPAVILLHGFGVDGLGQWGDFDVVRPLHEKRRAGFIEAFGAAPPSPEPPAEGREGIIPLLVSAGFRVIVPDMRGFGGSSKPTDAAAYADSAMARDVIFLIEHLALDDVRVAGFSMGAGTVLRLLILDPLRVKGAIAAGISDFVVEGAVLEFPSNWPVPESVPRPLTSKIWALEGAKILEGGELVRGHLASANLIAARATGADPKVLAAVIRGAVAEPFQIEELNRIATPLLFLNGKTDVANQKNALLLREIKTASAASCEGDHHTTPYQPSFHRAVIAYFKGIPAG